MKSKKMETLDIIVDKPENARRFVNNFFLPSDTIEHIKYLNDDKFDGCSIRSTPTEKLTNLLFSYLNQKLKDGGVVEVIIDQPVRVMQTQDERVIRMNATFAGFSDFTVEEQKFVEPLTDINYTSLIMTFKKSKRVIACDFDEYHIKPYISRGKIKKSVSPGKRN
jgi:hypothetical protein